MFQSLVYFSLNHLYKYMGTKVKQLKVNENINNPDTIKNQGGINLCRIKMHCKRKLTSHMNIFFYLSWFTNTKIY
jgi:hypothetical protein